MISALPEWQDYPWWSAWSWHICALTEADRNDKAYFTLSYISDRHGASLFVYRTTAGCYAGGAQKEQNTCAPSSNFVVVQTTKFSMMENQPIQQSAGLSCSLTLRAVLHFPRFSQGSVTAHVQGCNFRNEAHDSLTAHGALFVPISLFFGGGRCKMLLSISFLADAFSCWQVGLRIKTILQFICVMLTCLVR